MIRRFLMPILLLWLASCAVPQQPRAENSPSVKPSSTVSQQPRAENSPSAKPSSIVQSPSLSNTTCRNEIPEALLLTFGEFRLAQPEDFIPKIQQFDREPDPLGRPKINFTCSIFAEDFNQDSQPDYAVLLVNPQTQTAQFRLAISQGKDTFTNVVIRDYPKPPESIAQPLYVAMFLKRSGESGASSRAYFPLKRGNPKREVFIANPAIELWLSPAVYLSGVSPSLSEEARFNHSVGYGSEIFYFVDGQLNIVGVAD